MRALALTVLAAVATSAQGQLLCDSLQSVVDDTPELSRLKEAFTVIGTVDSNTANQIELALGLPVPFPQKITVFAPQDAAWPAESPPPLELVNVIETHVVAEDLGFAKLQELAAASPEGATRTSLQGEVLLFQAAGDAVTVSVVGNSVTPPALIVRPDLAGGDACSGPVHVIDQVLQPGSLVATESGVGTAAPIPADDCSVRAILSQDPDTSLVLAGVSTVSDPQLSAVLMGETAAPHTILAPTNAAFSTLTPDRREALLANPTAIIEVLRLHVLPSKILSTDLPEGDTAVTALSGQPVTFTNTGGALSITTNGGTVAVVGADLGAACPSVVHKIDGVLLPAPGQAQAQPAVGDQPAESDVAAAVGGGETQSTGVQGIVDAVVPAVLGVITAAIDAIP